MSRIYGDIALNCVRDDHGYSIQLAVTTSAGKEYGWLTHDNDEGAYW